MDTLKAAKQLNVEGNIADNYEKWKTSLDFYFVASGTDKKSDAVKIASFMHIAGEEAQNIFKSMKWSEDDDAEGDDKKYSKVTDKFKKHCQSKKNITYTRYQFFSLTECRRDAYCFYH